MTKKRFTFHHDVDGIDYIQDETNGFCLICDKLLCSLLNELHDENEQLKKVAKCELVANHRGEMVSFADSLIRDFCNDEAIEMWEKFKEEKWEEYKYKTEFS